MKHFYLFSLLSTSVCLAQIPSDYYDSANGLSGFALKTELKNITTTGHFWSTSNPDSYDELYTAYVNTHSDLDVTGGTNYENDGTILDFYSEKPLETDPYNYTHGNNQCGNQTQEGDCYNREHLVPQSSFSSAYPMQSDIHHVIPTDGRVNNFRGSLPFGEVATPNFTSLNGSLRGSSAVSGYSGTMFEPIDEFKGDIARALLYFATRYEDNIDTYTSFDMFNGTENQVFQSWAINILLDWHYNVDPVDQRERERNEAAYTFQGNANPFVDHPEYANAIWNPSPDTEAPSNPTNLVAANPTTSTLDLSWTASTDNIGVVSYDIYQDGVNSYNTTSTIFTVTGLLAETNYCFTIKAKDAAGNESGFSNQDCETTSMSSSGSGECANENFESIPADNSAYTDRIWTGNDGQWSATRARTDQTINNRAIVIDCRDLSNGTLTSPTISGGIGNLTITTQRIFNGSDGTLDVLVNGNVIGTIPYNDTAQTTTISNINIEGNVTVVIKDNNSGSARIGLDDLSWSCYSTLNTSSNKIENISVYPNPSSSDLLHINSNSELVICFYDMLGKKVLKLYKDKGSNQVNLKSLKQGIYFLKIESEFGSITKKIVKQ